MLEKNELKYWLAFNQISTVGPRRWQKLLDYFGELKNAWMAPRNELFKAGMEEKITDELINQRSKINPEAELEKLQKTSGQAVTILDETYPGLLKEIYSPPPLLYCLGRLDLNGDFPLAVVGSRKISDYGKAVTEQIVNELAGSGLTIVSGMAIGVDAVAHQTALKAGGKTVAVLGSGINQIYPATNRNLARQIIESGGAIISEFPLGTPPYKSNFPQRNRIISGLSLGVLVTEATEDSGALITTKYALDQNREIFAVPGDIFRLSAGGPNKLIKLGAKAVTSADEILETLNLQQAKNFKAAQAVAPAAENEKKLLVLMDSPIHVDNLARKSRLDISIINSTLAIMEMKGLIKNLGGQLYVKAR